MWQSSIFETPEVGIIGNKLEIVANQMNYDTNLDLSRAYWSKTNVTGN